MKRRLMNYWDLIIFYYLNIECRNETGIVTEVEITYNFQAEKILHISITTETFLSVLEEWNSKKKILFKNWMN